MYIRHTSREVERLHNCPKSADIIEIWLSVNKTFDHQPEIRICTCRVDRDFLHVQDQYTFMRHTSTLRKGEIKS